MNGWMDGHKETVFWFIPKTVLLFGQVVTNDKQHSCFRDRLFRTVVVTN